MQYNKNLHHLSKILFLIAIMPIFVLASYLNVRAKASQQEHPTTNCTAVDLVILIDQSDSMFSINDRNGRRFNAAQTIINYLGNHATWLCSGQDVKHRVAVVGFGDRSRYLAEGENSDNDYREDIKVYLPPTVIPSEESFSSVAEMRQAWKEYRNGVIAPAISSGNENNRENNLNATDHKSGLLAAQEILNQWGGEPLPGIRRQSIFIITDGEPCLFWRGCDQGQEYYDIQPDMRQLRTLTDNNGVDFPFRGAGNPDSIFISVVLLSQRNKSFSDLFIQDWEDITSSHGGTMKEVSDAPRLSPIIADMLTPVVQTSLQTVTCDKPYWVTPYVDDLTILYAFALIDDPEQVVNVTISIKSDEGEFEVQGGNSQSPDVQNTITDHVIDFPNESYVFTSPLPGEYRIRVEGMVNCADILDVRTEKRSVSGTIMMPAESAVYPATPQYPFFNEQAAEKFRIALVDTNGQPMVEFEDYPVQFEAVVRSEDGTHEQIFTPEDFVKLADDEGVYESKNFIETPIPGGYTWELQATVRNPEPGADPAEVFSSTGKFTANEVVLFGLVVEEPSEGDDFPLNAIQGESQAPLPIPVSVKLVDVDGSLLNNLSDILPDLREPLQATLYQGSALIETIVLQPKPGSLSEFVGEFSNTQGADLLTPGIYTIDVEALWDRDDYDLLHYAPFNKKQPVSISQYEIVPLSLLIVPPNDLTLHRDDWRINMLQGGQLQPFDFQIEIINALTGETVPLETVLADDDAEFQASLIPPSGNPVAVSLTSLTNENFQQLLGQDVGSDMAEEGDYQIKLETTDLTLQEGYAWTAPEQSATFSRRDTTRTKPGAWRTIGIVILFLFLILLGVTLFFWTGGPSGKIEIVMMGTYGDQQTEAGPWRLKRWPRKNRIRHHWLKSNEIKYLLVRKTEPLDPDYKRVVHVVAVDKNGLPVYDSVLYPDSAEPFVEEDIVYK